MTENSNFDTFQQATTTLVLSDLHLSDEQVPKKSGDLWKRYKHRDLFIDEPFSAMLNYLHERHQGKSVELVLNGDIFDFDSVIRVPKKPWFPITRLERMRGLRSEEKKSLYKIRVILADHTIWVDALRTFVERGHRIVFVIGNHDMELHWSSVQEEILDTLEISSQARARVRFCEWFYVSNRDTLIEHGHQHDMYCACQDPVFPLIKRHNEPCIRLPFGNLAARLMMNGMGFFNPHVESSFIKPLWGHLSYFYKYIMRRQPFLIVTWAWSAMVTWVVTFREGLMPALKDASVIESRVENIATKANATAAQARMLRAQHVHPAVFRPWAILRELWLDRALLAGGIVVLTLWSMSLASWLGNLSPWWGLIPLFLLSPSYLSYSRTVSSNTTRMKDYINQRATQSARLIGLKRLILGHTHIEEHHVLDGVEVLNPGSWSPAFEDIACTRPVGKRCVVSIEAENKGERHAKLQYWYDGALHDDSEEDRNVFKQKKPELNLTSGGLECA